MSENNNIAEIEAVELEHFMEKVEKKYETGKVIQRYVSLIEKEKMHQFRQYYIECDHCGALIIGS